VLVDADCLVAGTLTATGATTALLTQWQEGAIELIICPRLVNEVSKTLLLPRIAGKYGISRADVEDLARRLIEDGVMFDDPVDPPRVVPEDPNDDYLIALAIESEADYFVTRDKHFDGVRVTGVRIITPGRLLRELR
jgi:uncharacterized protein